MGFGFPTGMRLVSAINTGPTPWFWGINGAASVLAASVAVVTSIAFSIDTTLKIGADLLSPGRHSRPCCWYSPARNPAIPFYDPCTRAERWICNCACHNDEKHSFGVGQDGLRLHFVDKEVQRDSEKLALAEHCALLLRVGV